MEFMRLLVFFDLPTGSKADRKAYSKFRKFLVQDGYHMEQYSVYSRVLTTRESVSTHVARLKASLPAAGKVTVLELTERQYENRHVFINDGPGEPEEQATQLTLVF